MQHDESFVHRHIGPDETEVAEMLRAIGCGSLDDLVRETIPASILLDRRLRFGPPRAEADMLAALRDIARRNRVLRSFIGMGYHGTITPAVIQRNILENPGWYTQYTPYQAEIAQGRLEALLNFQTMVSDLTGLPVANASLLDEATAAAEAMTMCARIKGDDRRFFIAADCHRQTVAVVQTRARSMGLEIVIDDPARFAPAQSGEFCGVLLQYPATDGRLVDYSNVIDRARKADALVVMAADPLALTLLKPPGAWGADIAIGSTQRFGVPMGFGGPHAAYFATRDEYVRKMPGRLIGVSKDANGKPALRMAIQTREQHIRRDRATSNICTAQVLLAIMASMYAVYHGPEGLRKIARRVHRLTLIAAEGFRRIFEAADASAGVVNIDSCFDTITIEMASRECVTSTLTAAHELGFNLRDFGDNRVGFSLDETTTMDEVRRLWLISETTFDAEAEAEIIATAKARSGFADFARASEFLTHPVFNTHHSETEMLRYMTKLQSRDLSLAHSMIPLGSCTMKLNATAEMVPVTWPEFSNVHPFAPADQTEGYQEMFRQLEAWLCEITGFEACSLQPNAGSQGEYAGLLAIRGYHESRGDTGRNVCLIPTSAHGTNPASAIVAGMSVVAVQCDEQGNIDLDDLRAKSEEHRHTLSAIMVTYPSTHGVFEETIRQICEIVHENGGLVYLDGANMNAQVGLCRPGDFGADVCHLNLHKTFCIPHGGGGPGMGPICATAELAPHLPGLPIDDAAVEEGVGPVSAAPYGSASILPISWMYIALMGAEGLTRASEVSILNANYMAKRLEDHYDILYRGKNERVAHEFILDCRPFEKSANIRIDDIAKRLMDYGFHAPTMAWPVAGTLMVEPTESESRSELDRYCDALIGIRAEIKAVEEGHADREDNVLKNAPHTIEAASADEWTHPYSRQQAAFPAEWLRDVKFWPHVGRIDNPWGDRNLFCTCAGLEEV